MFFIVLYRHAALSATIGNNGSVIKSGTANVKVGWQIQEQPTTGTFKTKVRSLFQNHGNRNTVSFDIIRVSIDAAPVQSHTFDSTSESGAPDILLEFRSSALFTEKIHSR